MPSDRRRTCLICGNHESIVGAISWRGNCGDCAVERMEQAVMELHEHRGPTYRRWKLALLAALEDPVLDAPHVPA